MKKWAEQNPEEAAELRIHVFGVDQDSTQEWIKLQNKKRKMKEEFRGEKEKTAAEAAAERAEARADREVAEGAAGKLRPLMDMWGAATRKDAAGNLIPDFDTVDMAFENTAQMPIDEYMRRRARRGAANPEMTRVRAENARLQRELEAARPKETGAAVPSSQAPASPPAVTSETKTAAPVDLLVKWGDELPKGHKLRSIVDWPAKLEAAMDRYHDAELDEYSKDPEDVANSVLKRELALLADEEEEPAPVKKKPAAAPGRPNTPKRRAAADEGSTPTNVPGLGIAASKLVPRGKVNEDRSHKVIKPEELESFDGGAAARRRFAMDRWARRMRGEEVADE
jgi:hypothetical protein